MKKYLITAISCLMMYTAYCQSDVSFKINLQYAQTNRPELNTYLNTLTDSMQIDDHLDIGSGLGIGFAMVFGGNKSEFEAGGAYNNFSDEVGNETNNLLYYKNADITFYFGANYLPVNFFLLGGSFVINSANAKCNQTGAGNGAQYLESLPSVDFNIFRGYSVALKAQSGFYINLNKDEGNRMRLTGYYIYGLSDYNFYTVSEKRLKGFEGEQKTSYTTAGIELAILFGN